MVKRWNTKKRNIFRGGRRSYRLSPIYASVPLKGSGGITLSPKITKSLLVVAAILAVVYLFLFSSYFAVRDVIVEGNRFLDKAAIADAMPKGENIFVFDAEKTREVLLNQYPELKDVAIYRGIPNALKVVVLEKDTALIWQSGEKRYYISSQGEVSRQLASEEQFEEKVPKVSDKLNMPVSPGSSLVSPHFVSFVNNIHSQFFEVTNIKPVEYEIDETTFDLNLKTEAGFYIRFNTMRSSRKQLEDLKKVLVEKRNDIHEYVDLRIDGWAYYK